LGDQDHLHGNQLAMAEVQVASERAAGLPARLMVQRLQAARTHLAGKPASRIL
jgi:hypothetical protein